MCPVTLLRRSDPPTEIISSHGVRLPAAAVFGQTGLPATSGLVDCILRVCCAFRYHAAWRLTSVELSRRGSHGVALG